MDHVAVVVAESDNDGGDPWKKRLCPKLEKLMPEQKKEGKLVRRSKHKL